MLKRLSRCTIIAAAVLVVTGLGAVPAAAQYPLRDGSLTLSGSAGSAALAPGAPVTLSGGGFEPGTTVEIWMRSDPVLLETTRAGAEGAIDATVRIPADAPAGEHTLEARGAAAGGGTNILSAQIVVAGEGSPGTGPTDPSETAPGATPGAAVDDGALPFTGMPAALLALLGLALLAAGLLVARTARTRASG